MKPAKISKNKVVLVYIVLQSLETNLNPETVKPFKTIKD